MRSPRKLDPIGLVTLVALVAGVPAAGAQGWSAGIAAGSLQSLSYDDFNSYFDPVQEERQSIDADGSAILATVEWQFSNRLGVAFEYLHGGDATIEQSWVATAWHLDTPVRTAHELGADGFRTSLPFDARFASVGLVLHYIQIGRVEVTPRVFLSQALGLPSGSEIRLAGVGVPAGALLDGIPFGETLETFTRTYRVESSDDFGYGGGIDVAVALGWKRWQDRRSLNVFFAARFLRFDPVEAVAPMETVEVLGSPDPVRLPRARFKMNVEPIFFGAGLRYRF